MRSSGAARCLRREASPGRRGRPLSRAHTSELPVEVGPAPRCTNRLAGGLSRVDPIGVAGGRVRRCTMKLPGALASIIVFVSLLAATPAHPQASDPVPYALASPPSQFEWGCFGPCACPVLVRSPLTGTFALRQS